MQGLIIDSFAGGGGASTGIEMALGRSPDVAINHDEAAVAMHLANHPDTVHYCKNVWHADPQDVVKAAGGGPVALAWFSPDCKHFSKAKGGRPAKRHIRDLAWVVVLWAKRARPRVICLENVEEFRDWGPITLEGKPCPERKGQTFNKWVSELKRLGYKVQWRELRACDYGAPTIRKRLFLVARCDGNPIVWPEPTHGAPDDPDVIAGRKLPWRTAAEIIDWSLPCPSIFERKKPLAEATCRRIARGLVRYVIEAQNPFIISVAHGDSGGRREYPIDDPLGTVTGGGVAHALVAPHITKFRTGSTGHRMDEPLHTVTASSFEKRPGGSTPLGIVVPTLVQTGYGERPGQAPRVPGLDKPLGTVVAGGQKHALVSAFLAKHYGGVTGHGLRQPIGTVTTCDHHSLVTSHIVKMKGDNIGHTTDEPLHTITASGLHFGEVRAFLMKYYGTDQDPRLDEPLHTVTTKDRFGLVTVNIDGEPYAIADIGMRMLQPHELFAAQGFPGDYIIDPEFNGKPMTKTNQVRMAGNSVCPPVAAALIRANVNAAAVAGSAVA
ncbi:MAG: DNA cytosine methyltransferase [Alphaproteobacteria bacterium]|nr:DNA cytosine methyltransferase [Alphaproteobacteria bacterium]